MANDLVVQLGAKLDQFASDMNQAGDMADSAVSRIESSFAGLNPGIGLSGLAGIATGAVAAVGVLLTALQKINSELADISKNAEFAGVSTDRLQQIQFAASQKGGISPDQSAADLRNVAGLLADAKQNENSLTKLLDQNNIKYKDREGAVINTNQLLTIAIDLINRMPSMPEKVKAAQMLGLSQQWVQAVHDGNKAFEAVASSANDAGVVIDKSTIAKAEAFDKAWKASSALLSAQFKAAAADVAGVLDDLIDKAGAFFAELAKSQGATPGGGQERFNALADAIDVARKDAQGLDQDLTQVTRVLERYRQLATADPEIIAGLEAVRAKAQAIAEETERAAKAASAISFPAGVPLPAARPASANDEPDNAASLPKRDNNKDPFDRAVEQTNRRIALLEAETATIGLNSEARERAKIVAELEEAAKRANAQAGKELYAVTEATNPKIGEQADKMLAAARAAREQQTAFQGLNDAARFGGNELVNVLDQASQKGADFGKIMQSVMRDVTRQILQAAITGEGAFAKLFGTNSSSGGVGGLAGLLSKAFGGGGDISGGSSANPLPGLSAEDYGIGFKPGGYTGDGSRDDPAGIVHKGEWVFDQDAVKRIGVDRLAMLQRGYANGGPVGMPSIPSINSRGSGSDITVNLIEDSSRAGQVQKKDNGNGGFNIEAYVDSITARNVGNPGSATRASLASAGRVVRR